MIMDPCYVETQWAGNKDKKSFGIDFWGEGADEAAELLKKDGYKLIKKYSHVYHVPFEKNDYIDEATINKISGKINKIVITKVVGSSTYDQICNLTLSEEQAGQLDFPLGHPGLCVAFSSGLGDGVYDVYATYKTIPGWGERIVKVEVELI